jgi:hypothetical protein
MKMEDFNTHDFWEPFLGFCLVTALIVLVTWLFIFALSPRDYRNFYIDQSRNSGTYVVYQYVRWGTDPTVYVSTNPESALAVYKELVKK